MKVALVQLAIPLGQVAKNLTVINKYIIQAYEKNAEMVLFPEFFTSSMGFDDSMLDVAKANVVVPKQLKQWAEKYCIIIGGSFLFFDGKNIVNQFRLVFPNGSTYTHNKDIPTQYENCYYTYGDENNILNTPIGNIGVALCWEQIRTDTIKRMLGKVDYVIAGSCWWDLPIDSLPERESLRKYNQELALHTPSILAKLLGVPVLHSAHCGRIKTMRFPNKELEQTRNLVGATQAILGNGEVVAKRLWSDGEGILLLDLTKKDFKKYAPHDTPDTYWIPSLPESYIKAWETFNPLGEKYYKDVALPHYKLSVLE